MQFNRINTINLTHENRSQKKILKREIVNINQACTSLFPLFLSNFLSKYLLWLILHNYVFLGNLLFIHIVFKSWLKTVVKFISRIMIFTFMRRKCRVREAFFYSLQPDTSCLYYYFQDITLDDKFLPRTNIHTKLK